LRASERYPRQVLRDVAKIVGALPLQLRLVERRHRQGHILQALLALERRDHHFFDDAAIRGRVFCFLVGGQGRSGDRKRHDARQAHDARIQEARSRS
jgi:hypothetical protein